MKQSTSYLGYKITPHQWTETHTQYGQYDIFISETHSKHSGFKVTKGKRECGRAETMRECKALINQDRKYHSKKYLNRIKVLKKQEAKLYSEARKREKSSNSRVRESANTFYHRSRIAGHKAFNLEMGKPENSRY